MRTTSCDICKRTGHDNSQWVQISFGTGMLAMFGFGHRYELCYRCFKEIEDKLQAQQTKE